MPLPIGWTNDKSLWSLITDTVFTSSNKLAITTKTKFVFTDPLVSADSSAVFRLDPSGTLFPEQVEDFYLCQLSMKSEVPPGIGNFLDLCVETNGTIVYEDLKLYLLPPEDTQPINYFFALPATEEAVEFGMELFLTPSSAVDIWDIRLFTNKTFNIGLA